MTALSIRAAVASLGAIAIAGCTTSGIGTGQSIGGNLGATFSWTETGGTQGTMVAQLTNGQLFQGPMFQITSESARRLRPAVERLGSWLGLGRRLGRPALGLRLGRLGWLGSETRSLNTAVRSSPICRGQAASCAATSRLMSPSTGMAGGGLGQCQLPTGTIINAQFPRH